MAYRGERLVLRAAQVVVVKNEERKHRSCHERALNAMKTTRISHKQGCFIPELCEIPVVSQEERTWLLTAKKNPVLRL